ncbi:alpha/beta hydrolase family protein [Paenibacillus humicola]|uniref:alpha/beta hydrolase family protein n=1 Tax=Paenibacillus humicola TaxID=3110540 RepID=UPI00237BD7A5|nr:hypothetical protein [Paenibacillus humicola]
MRDIVPNASRVNVPLAAPSALPRISGLPDPFRFMDGTQVSGEAGWNRRREELKVLIQRYEYGWLPPAPDKVTASVNGKLLTVTIAAGVKEASFQAEVTLPAGCGEPCPAFIHTGRLDAGIFLSRGYALVEFKPGDVAADKKDVRAGAFYELYPEADAGALIAWAWGFHRVIDALEAVPQIDRNRIAVTGHSRFGKAALVSGVFDSRVAVTIPASSGLSGAANYRCFYEEGGANEKIENIYNYAPHWFTPLHGEFVGHADRLPFDQHEVMALVAPRALLITEGTEDYWTNPQGTGLSYRAAKRVYDFLGAADRIGIAYREGGHGMTTEDFTAMADFADKQFGRSEGAASGRDFDRVPYPEEPEAMNWPSV